MKSSIERLLLAGVCGVLLSAAAVPATAELAYLFGLSLGDQVRGEEMTPAFGAADVKRGIAEGLRGKRLTPANRQQLGDYMRASTARSDATHRRAAVTGLSEGQASYFIGLLVGGQLHLVGVTDGIDPAAVERGFEKGLQGEKLTAAQTKEIQDYAGASIEAMQTQNANLAAAFLARNAHESGVMTTSSGLQYKILAAGDPKGPSVAGTDRVIMKYKVRFLDGTEMDSEENANYPVSTLVQGFQEAVLLMKPNDRWEVYVPPSLAYGSQPRPRIAPNSLLIYDVELVSSVPGPAETATGAARTGVASPSPTPAP